MKIPTQKRCPYTRQALTTIDASEEHIIPSALGGSSALAVQAERKANNDLGSALDVELTDSPLIGLRRVAFGIRTYSGPPRLRLPGKVRGHEVPIEVTFSAEGTATHVRKPIEMDPSGQSGRIVIPADQEEAFTKKLLADYARKGKSVRLDPSYSLGSEMELDFGFDVVTIKRAMAKIAFLAAFRVLGDAFLDDPLYSEWHNCIFGGPSVDFSKSRLRGVAFDPGTLIRMTTPQIQPHEHVVVVANLGMTGPVAIVSLFGTDFHNMVCVAAEGGQYGLVVGQGEIAICDSTKRTMRFVDFTDFLVARSEGRM